MLPLIVDFLKAQTFATIACSRPNHQPYCFTCFYVFEETENRLIFKSSGTTYHEQLMREFPMLAGSILPDKLSRWHIRGLQFEAQVHATNDQDLLSRAGNLYHRAHPAALAMPGKIWLIDLLKVKFTDNKLGFGKKLSWEREPELIG